MPLKGKIDLRSDTFTEPTAAMRHAMSTCEVGDDVWELDPTVKQLEELGASILGKEASIFVPSSVMANLIAVMAHTTGRGEEILVGDRSHISLYEQGNVSTIGGVHVRTIKNFDNGTIDLSDLKLKIRPTGNVHFPRTSLVCLESSHNMCCGSAIPASFFDQVRTIIGSDIKLHIDGARLFNATTALGISPAEYVNRADSVNVCLSKGLAAPIGALLAGSTEFIAKSRMLRKALGGGMRQVGVIACCGIIALKDMIGRLSDDHENAQLLYSKLVEVPGIVASKPDTNIVKFSVDESIVGAKVNLSGLVKELESRNVFTITVDEGRAVRAVTHLHVTKEDVIGAANAVAEIISKIQNGTLIVSEGQRMY
jgi:threonine aldolase